MKKFAVIIVLLLTTCLILTGCSGNNKALITNGNFEGVTDIEDSFVLYYPGYDQESNGVKTEDFASLLASSNTAVTALTNTDEIELGEKVLRITTSNALGYMGIYQNVKLSKGSTYKVTFNYFVKGTMSPTTTGNEYIGLYFTVADQTNFNRDNQITAASQTWHTYTSYFKSENMDNATVGIQVGEKDYEVTATVYLDNFQIEKVSPAAVGSEDTVVTLKNNTFSNAQISNIWGVVIGALLTFAAVYVAYILYRRYMGSKEKISLLDEKTVSGKILKSPVLPIVLIIAAAAVIRTLIAVFTSGFGQSVEFYKLGAENESLTFYSSWLGKYGPAYFYSYNDKLLAPLSMYVLSVIGVLAKISGASTMSIALMIKMFAVLGDLVAIFFVYLIAKKRLDNISSAIVCGLYSIIPSVVAMSSAWAVWDSMTVALLLITVYFLLSKNYYGMLIAYLFAVLLSASALILLPFVLLYAVVAIIKSDKSTLYRTLMGLSLILWVILFYALSVPATFTLIKAGQAMAPITLMFKLVAEVAVYGFNAFNFASLLGKNAVEITLASSVVDIVFIIVLLIYCVALYWKKKNRLELVLIASFFIATMFTFSLRMRPYTMILGLAFMLIYAFLGNDKRVLFVFSFYASMLFINCAISYNVIGYDSGLNWTVIENKLVVNFLFGAINTLLTIYYAYLVYDILVSRKQLKILPMSNTYASSVKAWGERLSYTLNKIFRKKVKS